MVKAKKKATTTSRNTRVVTGGLASGEGACGGQQPTTAQHSGLISGASAVDETWRWDSLSDQVAEQDRRMSRIEASIADLQAFYL